MMTMIKSCRLLLLVCLSFLLSVVHATEEPVELWGTDECETVSCRFKAPHRGTPPQVANQWHQEDEQLWNYVQEHVPDVLEHTGSAAFDEHLKGVQAVLRHWGAPTYLCHAGLFHSIYGTEGFQGFALPLAQRDGVRALIGERAEKLAFVFCMLDRSTFDQTVMDYDISTTTSNNNTVYTLVARPELGRFEMTLTHDEWLDFVELTLADWLEQVEGAAVKPNTLYLWDVGQAFAYRRLAYRKMSRILAQKRAPRLAQMAPQMYQQVMDTESRNTRHLVQMKTPPQSTAAQVAQDALRAAGELDIPIDLAPKPMEEECAAASVS
ncbi:expressed unknown protein [Seminavis robusta]|uniref:DUF6817 domain-containing protein n=1 Tax=Seminavis robusta TaxID=568900 RepID=A0A9N8HXG2_9STRA|nr:expressed unknown protein [Seminavis robusta]|eukprot:Sro1803_g298630.1 n/a (323) ;mRNA; f:11738-12706